MTFDTVISGAEIIDGSRSPRYRADVAISQGRIAAIGDLRGQSADRHVDASGLVLAPGFIDAHTHDDQALLSQPDMVFKTSQGVTTVVVGNCGISAAPLIDGMELPMPLSLLESPATGRFSSFTSYLDALRQQPPAVNVAALIGHSTLRAHAMSSLDRAADPQEISRMREQLRQALDAGAIGLSTGTFYPPARCATTEEIIEVGRPLSAVNGLYVTHMRDEADHVMDSLEETFSIGRALDIPVAISHHKVSGPANFGRTAQTLPLIRETMKHQCVSLDCYPYTAGSTMIRTDAEMLQGRVFISYSQSHPEFSGKYLDDIAAVMNVDKVEAATRLQPGSAIYFTMDESDVRRVMAFEETMIGSDGIPSIHSPHPRLWGTFPRVLGHYSRDVGLFPLETAVWKMTGLTARNFGLKDRGLIKEKYHADLVIFDPQTVMDAATYILPMQKATGIHRVFVNGSDVYVDREPTGSRSGLVVERVARNGLP